MTSRTIAHKNQHDKKISLTHTLTNLNTVDILKNMLKRKNIDIIIYIKIEYNI
jgi:hypothetical protein